MRKALFLFVAIFLAGPSARADLRATWKSLCEKHLIAEEPDLGPDPRFLLRLTLLHDQAPDPVTYADRVVFEYRTVGGKIYWLNKKKTPSISDLLYKEFLQNYLHFLGREMREFLIRTKADLEQKIDDAFFDYQYLESLS